MNTRWEKNYCVSIIEELIKDGASVCYIPLIPEFNYLRGIVDTLMGEKLEISISYKLRWYFNLNYN